MFITLDPLNITPCIDNDDNIPLASKRMSGDQLTLTTSTSNNRVELAGTLFPIP